MQLLQRLVLSISAAVTAHSKCWRKFWRTRITGALPASPRDCPWVSPLSSQFLAFDTQMLMGNRRYSLNPEEYIFGALNIYLDIIYIFSFFLQFFGSSQE